jgi:hypothetical protein
VTRPIESVCISEYYEILALHRLLFEGKFDDQESPYAGSPYIAAIQNRLADALEAAEPAKDWGTWRSAEIHADRVELVRRRLGQAGEWWQNLTRDERRTHVRDLLAPLRASDELINTLAATT